ncbi:alginate export family protein [Enterovirga rhinocerotis]|uniref:Alginate export protein n=1 Tax=Enterovirga rhinocerotis TaxID=1339210 RepID=A0A4R7BIT3_9HYPH|nr:alginate export family protein [Enterovirga rhinocerotis]TDR85234.1 alginate export protein [Enterovirga rhinocerotis]
MKQVAARILVTAMLVIPAAWHARAEPAAPARPPAFTNWRYGEDYGYLRDPAHRTGDPWEALKFVPLDGTGTIYASFGADLRLRYEGYRDNSWGRGPKPDDRYVWSRIMPYADLHLGPNVRLFGQLIGAFADRSRLTNGPVDETGVDLLQGFAQLRLPGDGATWTLQGGRQLVAYGSERLIGLRFGPNVPQAFDGGIARLEAGDWRVDGFFLRPVENNLHGFDDRTDGGRRAAGLYATLALPTIGPRSGLDLYYIGYHRALARFDQGAGTEDRHTLGTRFFGRSGGWSWDHEAFLQFGTFGRSEILAWSVATSTRYTFADLPLAPFLELKANAISGDRNPDDRRLGTFNAMFPRGKYFGEIGLIGPSNLLNLHPAIGIDLGSGWSLSAAAVFYWRESLGDGIYGNPGNLLRSAGTSRARYIGTQAEAVLGWQPTRNLSVSAAYAVLEPGRFIVETGPSKTVHFVGTDMQLRF